LVEKNGGFFYRAKKGNKGWKEEFACELIVIF